MSKRLFEQLQNIQRGELVNWPLIKKGLIKARCGITGLNQAVSATPLGAVSWKVVITDEAAFEAILKSVQPTDKSSRKAASTMGNTHKTSVNGALLVGWGIEQQVPYNHLFKPEIAHPTPTKQHALIVENLECFLNRDETYKVIRQLCGVTHDISDFEFIFGAGNSITNRLIIPYLKSFKGEVFCLLDLDLGGLTIYSTLVNSGLSKANTHFLVPRNIHEYLSNSKRKASSDELIKLSRVLGVSCVTDKLVTAIRHYGTTVEQEAYRASI